MELPDDVIRLIREYSRPVTNPNWKQLQKMTQAEFGTQLFIQCRVKYRKPLFMRTFEKSYQVFYDTLKN
jgi:hypothetical protein